MADKIIDVKITQRTDTESNWKSKNPVLLKNEHAYTSGTGKYKIGDGTKKWSELTYYEALNTGDKTKLDGIAEGANKTVVDSTLSDTSTNPVQNKVIKKALDAKSNKDHTHKYAGSSSAGGVANSATKLSSSRTVAGGTDITLSFNYDGSANSSAAIGYYSCKSILGNKNNYPYHRFAKLDKIVTSYTDKSTTFYISQDYYGGGFGIAILLLRTNNTSQVSTAEIRWLVRSGLSADCLQIGLYNVYGQTYADAFFKHNGTYSNATIRAIASGSRGLINRAWVLNDSEEKNNTTDTDRLTSTEVYTSIGEAATKLHGQEYTTTIIAKDSGSVNQANQVDWSGVQNQPNYAGSSSKGGSANSAVKLDSSAGSALQPIYFSSGKPTACTYSLAKSVPSDAKFTDTIYTHPAYTAKANGLYKISVDNKGHVNVANTVTKTDITGLGISGSEHTHDNRYYTESEMNSKLDGKSNTGHTHDDRYYTESEINTKLSGKSDTTHIHDDRYYTEDEVNTKLSSYLPLSGGTLTGLLTATGGVQLTNGGTWWLGGKTVTDCIVGTKHNADSYYPVIRVDGYSGHVANFGGIGDKIGFYGYKADRTVNGNDWQTEWDMSTGNIETSGTFYAGDVIETGGEYSSRKDNLYWRFGAGAGTADNNKFGFWHSSTGTKMYIQSDGLIVGTRFSGCSAQLGRSGDSAVPMTFNWTGKDGQPTWLWGGEDGSSMYVYNPSNFSVASARSLTGNATDWTDGNRRPICSAGGDGNRIGYISSRSNNIAIVGQWGSSSYSTKTINVSSSDIRLKTNISSTTTQALSLINQIKMRQFTWKDTGEYQKIGVVADELEQLDPRLVEGGGYDEEGRMNVKCINTFYLTGYLTKGIQELSIENTKLKQENTEIKAQLDQLQNAVNEAYVQIGKLQKQGGN